MSMHVVNGAELICNFGTAPATLVVLPINMVMCGDQPAANIMDHIPMMNIMPFGMCQSLSNPAVAAATAAGMGALTPMPCIPNTPAPWIPGSQTAMFAHHPALNDTCKCMCMWAGIIQITNPGQTTTNIA